MDRHVYRPGLSHEPTDDLLAAGLKDVGFADGEAKTLLSLLKEYVLLVPCFPLFSNGTQSVTSPTIITRLQS